MSDFKDIADVADRLIYEVIALLLPGALFALLLVAIVGPELLGPDAWNRVLAFAAAHKVITGAISYGLGYVVQGLSRAVAHRLDATLRWIWASVKRPRDWIVRKLSDVRASIERRIFRWPDTPEKTPIAQVPKTPVDLDQLLVERLSQRLGLDSDRHLTNRHAQDLAFSMLVPEIKRLERFRAAASCARGLATVVAIGWIALVGELTVGLFTRTGWPLTWWTVASVIGVTTAFNALMNRERMYEATWKGIIAPQYLIATTKDVVDQGGADDERGGALARTALHQGNGSTSARGSGKMSE